MREANLRSAFHGWNAFTAIEWDTALCLHVPGNMRMIQMGWDDLWLQRVVSRYFHNVDRRIFGNAHTRRGVRSNRLVTMEHSVGVGWHSHIIASTPPSVSQDDFRSLLKKEWLRLTEHYASNAFKKRLVWVEPLTDGYADYCTKYAFSDLSGNINSQSVAPAMGTVDWQNTHFSE